MRVIYWYKYQDDMKLPKGYIIRNIGMKQEVLTVWAEVDPFERELVNTHLQLVPTGITFNPVEFGEYIGTVHQEQFIRHIYQSEE